MPTHRTPPIQTGVVHWTAPCRPLIRTAPTMHRQLPASVVVEEVEADRAITRAGTAWQMFNDKQTRGVIYLRIYLLETGKSGNRLRYQCGQNLTWTQNDKSSSLQLYQKQKKNRKEEDQKSYLF